MKTKSIPFLQSKLHYMLCESADISLRTFVCCRPCGAQRRWITEWSWLTAVQMVMKVILGTWALLSPTGWRRTHWVCCTTHRRIVLHPSTSPIIHTSTWLDRYGHKHTVYEPYTASLCEHNRCIPIINAFSYPAFYRGHQTFTTMRWPSQQSRTCLWMIRWSPQVFLITLF